MEKEAKCVLRPFMLEARKVDPSDLFYPRRLSQGYGGAARHGAEAADPEQRQDGVGQPLPWQEAL